MRWLPASLLAATLAAAVPGVPEAGPAGVLPLLSLCTGNDMFGNGLGNGDDFRTAGLMAQARLGAWVVAAEGSMLTDRGAGTRSDQAQLALGRIFGDRVPRAGWHATALLGGGLQCDGDLGGEAAQNAVHEVIGAQLVHLADDRGGVTVRPLLMASAVAGWVGPPPSGLGLAGWWGAQLVASTSWVAGAETLGECGPRLVLVGRQGAFWLGARVRLRDGDPPTATAAATGAHEDGWWLDSGTYITPFAWDGREIGWQVRAAINPETRAALGSVGLVVCPGSGPAGATVDLDHDLAVYGGGAFGVQLRWHPWPWQDRRVSAAFLDYRFGTEPDGAVRFFAEAEQPAIDGELREDQWTAGWEEALRSPDWSGLRFVPFVQAGAGVRSEGLLLQGAGPRAEAGHATMPVAVGAAGVRLVWREVISAGASLDGWLPAWRERLGSGPDAVVLGDPGWAIGYHLAAHIAW